MIFSEIVCNEAGKWLLELVKYVILIFLDEQQVWDFMLSCPWKSRFEDL